MLYTFTIENLARHNIKIGNIYAIFKFVIITVVKKLLKYLF